MTDKLQAKIDRINELAKASKGKIQPSVRISSQTNDGLLKVIRNPEEAAKFMAQLDMVFNSDKNKK